MIWLRSPEKTASGALRSVSLVGTLLRDVTWLAKFSLSLGCDVSTGPAAAERWASVGGKGVLGGARKRHVNG